MVQLVDRDIKTREVLDWKGLHVLHYMGSSCSQKLRIPQLERSAVTVASGRPKRKTRTFNLVPWD
jgi:hypothetical protein